MSTTEGLSRLNFAAVWYVRHARWARLCYNLFVKSIDDMVVDTEFHEFHCCTSFARTQYLFLIKDIGRRLPWVLPGSTGRFYKDDFGP